MKKALKIVLVIEALAYALILFYTYYYLPHRNCPSGGCSPYSTPTPVHEFALLTIPALFIITTILLIIIYKIIR